MPPDIGISESNRQNVVKILNALLSDEYVLYTKTRDDHWNVAGPQFDDPHTFFEAQYSELSQIVGAPSSRGAARIDA